MKTKEELQEIVDAIEDGELDDYFVELREALDDRLQRKKDSVMKLVKATFGDSARIVNGEVVTGPPTKQEQAAQPPPEVVLPDGSVLVPDDPSKFQVPPDGLSGDSVHIPEPNITPDILDDMPGQYINRGSTIGNVQ